MPSLCCSRNLQDLLILKPYRSKLLYQLQSLCHKLEKRATKLEERERIQEQIEVLNRRIVGFDHDIQDINERINERSQVDPDIAISLASGSNARMPNETQREFLIRISHLSTLLP